MPILLFVLIQSAGVTRSYDWLLGHLAIGAVADIAIFRLEEGHLERIDSVGEAIQGCRKQQAEITIRARKIVWDLNGLTAKRFAE